MCKGVQGQQWTADVAGTVPAHLRGPRPGELLLVEAALLLQGGLVALLRGLQHSGAHCVRAPHLRRHC